MKCMEYNNVPCNGFFVSIGEHCNEAHELAEEKEFIGMSVNDGYDNYYQCNAIEKVPPYGPPSLLEFRNDMQKGWLIYEWYVVIGGIRLSLFNPQTEELSHYYVIACGKHTPSRQLRFCVPRKNLSTWERFKAIFQPAIKTRCYDVEIEARPTENKDEHQYSVVVTERHDGVERIYQFLNTTHRKNERLVPQTVNIYEYTDF